MTKKYLLSEILRIIDSEPIYQEPFSEEQLIKYRIVTGRLSENDSARPFRVVFCGVFSSGKTSLLNTLLGCGFQLPEGVNPVTKMVTRIERGDAVACAYRLNGRKIDIPNDYITALIRGKKQLIFDSHELIIAMPSDILNHHVEFIDTPGFNDEAGGALENMSREAIYEADMAVMCCNCLQLGKILERDLLHELDEMMGHFSLVVTRMDNLNTAEDCDAIISQANQLMLHKGNDASVFMEEQPLVFPVVTVGPQKNTKSFEGYLMTILSDESMRRRIRSVSDGKGLALCLDEIQTAFEQLTSRLREELAELVQKNHEAIRQREWEAQMEKNKFAGIRNEARAAAAGLAEEHMRRFAEVIRTMQNPNTFQEQANQLTHGMINDYINDIAAYSERAHIAGCNDVKLVLCREYFALDFSVPPPMKTAVKKRGLLGRSMATAANLASLNFRIDNGCDEVYTDYHEPTIQAVRSGPMDWIAHQWDIYLEQLYNGIKTAGFSGGLEPFIQKKQELLNQCESVKRMISSC